MKRSPEELGRRPDEQLVESKGEDVAKEDITGRVNSTSPGAASDAVHASTMKTQFSDETSVHTEIVVVVHVYGHVGFHG